jgi:tetratricopeptide (TPR) repeat protein
MVGPSKFISGKRLMDMRAIVTILALFVGLYVSGQGERRLIREGNKQYTAGKFTDAETAYRKAINKNPKSVEAAFNIGNTLYKQGKFEDAAKQFSSINDSIGDKQILSKSFYNLGNAYFKANKLQESASAYKNALRNNSTDMDAKFNLSLVQHMLKQQQDKKDQDNKDNKDNKDKDKKDNKKDQDKQQNKNDQQKQDKQKQDQDKQKQDQDKQQQQPQQNQISREDAQRMLDALKNDEKAVQIKVQEQKAKEEKEKAKRSGQPEKNW